MASSSTSCHSTPTSSSLSWNYDVFLSFRGEDTRKTFVDHLHTRLVEHGIHTYKDDTTLARGESIGPALLKAIQESRIAIIVFSEKYADSAWCLDELACIMKCKDERGQIVLPVFYHVDPSDVRKQKGKYKEAFDKHESGNTKKVETWRKALFDASNLSGWVPTEIANGHESELIKYIVDWVSNTLFSLSSNVDEDLIGMSIRLQELGSLLEVGAGGVRMIGIWGMGGGGKTTLASAIYNEISSKFDGCCFLDNIREEAKNKGLKKLQKEILSKFLKKKDIQVGSVGEGTRMIKDRLCCKSVLIVLDDVDDLDQLKMLVGSNDWFGDRSRIIITTRDNHLLNAHKVQVIYHIRLLNDDEAMKLFFKHAPRQDNIPTKDYNMFSKDVVSYAGGLPLALKVLGRFVCDKDVNEWRSALTRLKDIPEDDIIGKLKISYDGLKPLEKELFLDIACFYRGKEIEEAIMSLDACGLHPIIGIKVLMQKALVTISKEMDYMNDSQIELFNMHDLVQEMGHYYVVQGEHPKNPEKHSRVWREKDLLSICSMNPTQKNTDKIEGLRLSRDMGCQQHDLLHIVATMKNLRSVYWEWYPSSLLPTNFQPTRLCCLILKRSKLIQLWEGYKSLPNLKVLDLTFSRNLIKTPDLGGLPCLERMILRHCDALREIHSSTGSHETLYFLDLKDCYKLEIFPPITRMPKLATLILSHCSRLSKFPDIHTNMDSLVDIRLRLSGIEDLPASIEQHCTNLVSLDLSYCERLTSIEVDFCHLRKLKELHLVGCDNLKTPAQDLINAECCLEVLSLHPMHQLQPPPPFLTSDCFRFRHLPRFLTHLTLRHSFILVDGDSCLRFDISELSSLKVLDLSLNTFSRIHLNLMQLPRLKFLDISYCYRLVELPDLPPSISVLHADRCDSLKITQDFPTTTYKWLWKVNLGNEVCGGENVLRSMFQGNAIIEDHFMSFRKHKFDIPRRLGFDISKRSFEKYTSTLQLPLNWYSDFSGFLICLADYKYIRSTIIIKPEMHTNYQSCLLDLSDDETLIERMCYIPFSSLMQKPLWNGNISFFLDGCTFKVELVPRRRRSKGGSRERSTEFWDEQYKHRKTFTIKHASGNTIAIEWLSD